MKTEQPTTKGRRAFEKWARRTHRSIARSETGQMYDNPFVESEWRMFERGWIAARLSPEPAAEQDLILSQRELDFMIAVMRTADTLGLTSGKFVAAAKAHYAAQGVIRSAPRSPETKEAGPDLVGALKAGLARGSRCICRGNLGDANPECPVHAPT